MSVTVSSYIKSDAAATARVRDTIAFPFPNRPQVMTVYVQFFELGGAATALSRGGSAVIVHIGANGNSNAPRFYLACSSGGIYQVGHVGTATSVTAGAGGTPTIGDLIELRGVLNADGSVTLGQTANGGAETLSGPSSALTFASAWAGSFLCLNGFGSGTGGNATIAICRCFVAAGVKTMQQMRALAGTD